MFFLLLTAINSSIDHINLVNKWSNIDMLFTIQINLKKFFSDSKKFVDMTHNSPLKKITRDYQILAENFVFLSEFKLSDKNIFDLKRFLRENFFEESTDLMKHRPTDYHENHEVFDIFAPELSKILRGINKVWLTLSYKVNEKFSEENSTLLPLPYPFMVPGQRFREFYYWDTFYLLEGLYVYNMYETIRNIILNFAHTIIQYGYIPNGMRVYYLNRSQPPLFTPCVFRFITERLYRSQEEKMFLLEAAQKEYEWYMDNRSVELEPGMYLNIYFAKSNYPRVESLVEDIEMFENKTKRKFTLENIEDPIYYDFFSNIKSIAESGLDFSSRWFENDLPIITDLIPTDLNAFMERNEHFLFLLFENINYKTAEYFKRQRGKRQYLMKNYLFDKNSNLYFDYNYKRKKLNTGRFYITSLYPYFYGPITAERRRVIFKILLVNFDKIFKEGGTPVGEKIDKDIFIGQWDYPNVWAPHQYDLCYFLDRLDLRLGLFCAQNFFRSAYVAYLKTGLFFEKYDCNKIGSSGGGGEYIPQAGFGFTNGTLAYFIRKYKKSILNIDGYELMKEEVLKFLKREILKSKL